VKVTVKVKKKVWLVQTYFFFSYHKHNLSTVRKLFGAYCIYTYVSQILNLYILIVSLHSRKWSS